MLEAIKVTGEFFLEDLKKKKKENLLIQVNKKEKKNILFQAFVVVNY